VNVCVVVLVCVHVGDNVSEDVGVSEGDIVSVYVGERVTV
jgi:hypothetical protein